MTDKYKMLPLHLACEEGDTTMISLLLARGAKPQTPSTPQACAAGRPVGLAVDLSAEVDALAEPKSPIPTSAPSPMSARRKQLLLAQQQHGGSAVFIARRHEHHDAVALLERAASGEPIPMPDLTALGDSTCLQHAHLGG